jgi:hypothetical protein
MRRLLARALIEVPVTGIILQAFEGRIHFQPGHFRASVLVSFFEPVKGGISLPDSTVVPAGEKSRGFPLLLCHCFGSTD